ncbi:hypothetical protein B7P43_G04830 [Cryptotermes secundus]|uniref:Leucine-rich repeat-containing protein 56 n=1 Tax=Cryptotermes secundus TaxID=105785 RepID=A0A2J7R3B8_9NEOP|nr:uncharacterized protein LOC111863657 [Cryptotermes secundus]PNF35322.1 hypothetical protein B7P43_G04830 [Cryptotermes secundus]
MSPYCHETGHTEASGDTEEAAGLEAAAPDTDSPLPSPSPSVTPTPSTSSEELAEEAAAHYNEQYLMVMNPPAALQNGVPDCLPIDHNLPHLLRQVSGNADLESVRAIKLRIISRETSLQRLAVFVPNLRELNLEGSCLGSLRDLGYGLTSLNVLKVTKCGLDSLDGTFGLTSLRELHASNNMVADVGPCSSLPHIRIIDLGKNAVEDLSFLEFLNICSHLEELTLAECPASSKSGYRATIRHLLPNLITLDGIPVTEDGGEHNFENSDDEDDEDDENGATFRPCQDSVRLISHGGPDTSQHHGTSRGQDGGSGGSGYQSPNQNERDHGNEEGALDSSNTSNEVDSPNYSSSGHQTHIDVCPAQSAGSDSTGLQLRQKMTRRADFKKRPTTAAGITDASSKERHGLLRKYRPSSAATSTGDDDFCRIREAYPSCDPPSTLTSGLAVCGNLTVALRGRRRRRDAWTGTDIPPVLELREKISEMPLGHILYRKHVQTDESKATSIKKEENKICADVKRFQSKAPPCCPQLFTRHDTSYDADISSNLELSPQTE